MGSREGRRLVTAGSLSVKESNMGASKAAGKQKSTGTIDTHGMGPVFIILLEEHRLPADI